MIRLLCNLYWIIFPFTHLKFSGMLTWEITETFGKCFYYHPDKRRSEMSTMFANRPYISHKAVQCSSIATCAVLKSCLSIPEISEYYSVFAILELLRIGARKFQNNVNHLLTWDVLECRLLWRLLSFSSSWNNHWFYDLFIFFELCPPPPSAKIKETAFILCQLFRYDSSYITDKL